MTGLLFVLKASFTGAMGSMSMLLKILGTIYKAGKEMARALTGAFKGVVGILGGVVSAFQKVLSIAFNVAAFIATSLYGAVKKVFNIAWDLATKAFGAIRDALYNMADDWSVFEREADRAFGLIAGEATATFEQIKRVALSASYEFGKALFGVQRGLFDIISAGFRNIAAAAEVLEAAASLAVAGWIEMDQSVKVLVTTMNAYGISADKAREVTALLYETQIQGRGTMGQFARLLGQVLPVAAATGYSLQDAAAASALVTKVMGQHGRVMFSVIAALRHMIEPTKKTEKAWERYGYAVVRTSEGLVDLKASLDRLRVIRQVFGDEAIRQMFRHQAAIRGIGVMTKMTAEAYNEVWEAMRSGAIQMQDYEASLAATQTRAVRLWEVLVNKILIVRVAIFDLLQDVFRPVFDDILHLVEMAEQRFEALDKAGTFKRLVAALKEIVKQIRASVVYETFFAILIDAFDALARGTESFVTWLEKVAEEGLVFKALERLVGDFNEKLGISNTSSTELKEKIYELGRTAWKWIKKAWGEVVTFANVVGKFTTDTLPKWFDKLSELTDTVIPELTKAFNNWKAALDGIGSAVMQLFGDIQVDVEGMGDAIWKSFSEDIPNALAKLKEMDVRAEIKGWLEEIGFFGEEAERNWGIFVGKGVFALNTVYGLVKTLIDALVRLTAVLMVPIIGIGRLVTRVIVMIEEFKEVTRGFAAPGKEEWVQVPGFGATGEQHRTAEIHNRAIAEVRSERLQLAREELGVAWEQFEKWKEFEDVMWAGATGEAAMTRLGAPVQLITPAQQEEIFKMFPRLREGAGQYLGGAGPGAPTGRGGGLLPSESGQLSDILSPFGHHQYMVKTLSEDLTAASAGSTEAREKAINALEKALAAAAQDRSVSKEQWLRLNQQVEQLQHLQERP